MDIRIDQPTLPPPPAVQDIQLPEGTYQAPADVGTPSKATPGAGMGSPAGPLDPYSPPAREDVTADTGRLQNDAQAGPLDPYTPPEDKAIAPPSRQIRGEDVSVRGLLN